MSTAPRSTSTPERSATSRRSRSASGTPRVWMPTSASVVEVGVALDQLVRDPGERPGESLGVEQQPRRRPAREVRRHRAPFRPRWTGLKGLRLECRRLPGRRPRTRNPHTPLMVVRHLRWDHPGVSPAARHAGLAVAAVVVVSACARFAASLSFHAPWVTPDEMAYGLLGESLWETGRLTIRGTTVGYYSLVYPALVGGPLSLGGTASGIVALQATQALAMSLVAVPVFLWGRRLAGPGPGLAAAILSVLPPALAYSGLIMSEAAYYPAVAVALLLLARAVEHPTLFRLGVMLAVVTFAAAIRLQALVLLPVFLDRAAARRRGRPRLAAAPAPGGADDRRLGRSRRVPRRLARGRAPSLLVDGPARSVRGRGRRTARAVRGGEGARMEHGRSRARVVCDPAARDRDAGVACVRRGRARPRRARIRRDHGGVPRVARTPGRRLRGLVRRLRARAVPRHGNASGIPRAVHVGRARGADGRGGCSCPSWRRRSPSWRRSLRTGSSRTPVSTTS